jgi:hypothetical protein
LSKTNICILLWKYFARRTYSCSFHISKLNDLKVIHDLYSQCLTQIMSKATSFTKPEGVCVSATFNFMHFWDTSATLVWFSNILKDFLIILAVLAKERKNTFLAELEMPSHQDKKSQAPSNFSKVPAANYFLVGSLCS